MANFVGEKFGVLGTEKYNNSAIIKAIREDLKKEFPTKIYKFGVRRNGAGRVFRFLSNRRRNLNSIRTSMWKIT